MKDFIIISCRRPSLCQGIGKSWKRGHLYYFLMGEKLWGRWCKLEFKNSIGLWALALRQYLIIQLLLSTCLNSMTNIVSFPNNIVFMYVEIALHILLDKGIRYWHIVRRNSWTIIDLLSVHLELKQRMKNWIYWCNLGIKCPYKQRYIAGSARWSTKPLY